jgi:type IV pilus assembly protein PilN
VIRINLLTVERTRTRAKKPATSMPAAQRVTVGACLVLVATMSGIGWWFWSLRQQSQTLDREIAHAEADTRKLRSVLAQVQKFETRRAQLQQRVTLIEQLRKGQSAPARVLDQISRSVPDRLWLADLKQAGDDFTLDGFATSMTALSDFVASIENTKWFRKPVEIIDSQVTSDQKTGDLVKFVVKASYFDPNAPPPPPAPAKAAAKKK